MNDNWSPLINVFLRIMQIIGFTQLIYSTKEHRLYHSKLLLAYGLFLLAVFNISLFFCLRNAEMYLSILTDNRIGNTVDYINLLCVAVGHSSALVETAFRHPKNRIVAEKMFEVDQIFERILEVDIRRAVYQRQILLTSLVQLTVYLLIKFYVLALIIYDKEPAYLHYWFLHTILLVLCAVRYLNSGGIVKMLKWRFDLINDCLGKLKFKSDEKIDKFDSTNLKRSAIDSKNIQKTLFENATYYRLTIIRDVYHRLWELTSAHNDAFGASMLVNIGGDFLSITANCYWIIITMSTFMRGMKDSLIFIGCVLTLIPHIANVLLITRICHQTIQSAQKTALLVHKIPIDTTKEDQNIFIEQFSLQLMHQRIAFSAFGFFNIDLTLLYTIAGTITTYLVILIQFYMSAERN